MCTITVKVNENRLRDIFPELDTTAAISRWVQEVLDRRIDELVAKESETVDLEKLMMTTVTNQNTGTPSRLSRLQDAYDYKIKHGWTPLTPEEEVEFHKMVAEFTNL